MSEEILIKYIETTSKCNYSCPICVPRTRNCHMDMDEFYSIIDNNLDLFYKKAIWMDFNGEPLVLESGKGEDGVDYIRSRATGVMPAGAPADFTLTLR